MKLDELIYKRMVEQTSLTNELTTYAGVPAVFYSEIPDAKQLGWKNNQYPRICYYFDMQANQERKSVGELVVTLMCLNNSSQLPEQIEPVIRDCLKDVFLTPEHSSPYCFTWSGTDSFSFQNEEGSNKVSNDLIIGCDIKFDILEYPQQITTDPDPIVAMNRYMKNIFPEAIILGLDMVPEIMEAGSRKPVFYCRLIETEKGQETNTVAWMNSKIAVHVFCPSPDIRLKTVMSLANTLSLDGEVIMLDYSPMTIKKLQVDHQADYFKDGQLYVTGHYGLLRFQSKQNKVNHININLR